MRRILYIAIIIALLSTPAFSQSNDGTTTASIKRASPNGDGIEEAPLLTFNYKPTGRDGETFLVKVNSSDADGGAVTVEAYVNNQFFGKMARLPIAFFITPQTYGHLPFTLELIARDDFGNASRANVAITTVGLPGSLNCTFTNDTASVVGNNVAISKVGNSGANINYTSTNTDSGEQASVNASLQISSGGSASGTVEVTVNGTSTTYNMSGSASFESDNLTVSGLNISEGDNTTFTCE